MTGPWNQPASGSPAALRLRGHTLLCLQGYRGLGYSPDFVSNLTALHRRLTAEPDLLVTVVDEPDAVCSACPHLAAAGCALHGDQSEPAMRRQDQDVLARLGFRPGDCLSWRAILERIAAVIQGTDLPGICGSCRWLPLGYCREGIERLRPAPSHR